MSIWVRFLLLGLALGWVGRWVVPSGTLAHGSFEERLEAVDAEIAESPEDIARLLKRVDLYRQQGNYEAALAVLDDVEGGASPGHQSDFLRGRIYLDWERMEQADAALTRFLLAVPTHADALESRARARRTLGRVLEAALDYGLAIEHQRVPRPSVYLGHAEALSALGEARLEEAIETLDQGIARMGPVGTLQQAAIELEVRRGATDAALTRLDRMHHETPRKDVWLSRRGEILEQGGRLDEAGATYQRALEEWGRLPLSRRSSQAAQAAVRKLRSNLERVSDRRHPDSKGTPSSR